MRAQDRSAGAVEALVTGRVREGEELALPVLPVAEIFGTRGVEAIAHARERLLTGFGPDATETDS